MPTYDEHYLAYLRNHVHQADDWKICDAENWENQVREDAYRSLCRVGDKIHLVLIQHPETAIHTFLMRGVCSNYDIEHYDIDQALEAKFGDKVSTDSESGEFHASCHHTVANEVVGFLMEEYPELDFSSRSERVEYADLETPPEYMFSTVPGAGNWSSSRETLAALVTK